ncbi:hypothetical protein HK100_011263 [Physocladia obscura]|uniref:Uncharacterized protein n=1 Tax=Physocladia obscura TaxID=109957 RepID=A0AAD5T243_9FUNG|nr:hypothetical protein HK100_011263 [Physocladia obscura]
MVAIPLDESDALRLKKPKSFADMSTFEKGIAFISIASMVWACAYICIVTIKMAMKSFMDATNPQRRADLREEEAALLAAGSKNRRRFRRKMSGGGMTDTGHDGSSNESSNDELDFAAFEKEAAQFAKWKQGVHNKNSLEYAASNPEIPNIFGGGLKKRSSKITEVTIESEKKRAELLQNLGAIYEFDSDEVNGSDENDDMLDSKDTFPV